MLFQVNNGWLDQQACILSANCDERPEGTEIDLVVIHGISLPEGEFGASYIEALFTNQLDPDAHPSFCDICDLRVSAHVLIDRKGRLTQFVPFHQRAWHAGESCFNERMRCNDFSIGIELEGCDEVPYEAVQYQVLSSLLKTLMKVYPGIKRDRIVGHCDIAPGRKTDPGPAFSWQQLYTQLDSDQ